MVLENKPESSQDLVSDINNKDMKSSNSTQPGPKNIMDITDTEDSDVDDVHINKFGAKKTSRWNRPKIYVSFKDLEKVPTRRSRRISNLQKAKAQSQVKYNLLMTRYHAAVISQYT